MITSTLCSSVVWECHWFVANSGVKTLPIGSRFPVSHRSTALKSPWPFHEIITSSSRHLCLLWAESYNTMYTRSIRSSDCWTPVSKCVVSCPPSSWFPRLLGYSFLEWDLSVLFQVSSLSISAKSKIYRFARSTALWMGVIPFNFWNPSRESHLASSILILLVTFVSAYHTARLHSTNKLCTQRSCLPLPSIFKFHPEHASRGTFTLQRLT